MSGANRAIKRRRNQKIKKSDLSKTLNKLGSVKDLQALPELLEEALKANQHLAKENIEMQKIISETLEEHENAIHNLKKAIVTLVASSKSYKGPDATPSER